MQGAGVEAAERVLTTLIGTMGGAGFGIWVAWYMLTKFIPAREQAHDTVVTKLVEEFREEAKDCREERIVTNQRYETVGREFTAAVNNMSDALRQANIKGKP